MNCKNYVLLLGADQYLRERALAGVRQVTNLPIWTASKVARYKKNRYFDDHLEADPQNEEDLLKAINGRYKKGWFPKAIIPLNDWTLDVAHRINERLGIAHIPEKIVEMCRNKYEMKQAFKRNGVPTAPFKLVHTEDELVEAINVIGFPLIIKPYDFGGSAGVYLAENIEEAKKGLKKSKKIVEQYGSDFGIDGSSYIVESYIEGQEEISVEVVCNGEQYKVLAVTEKYLAPNFAELAHLVPSHRSNNNVLREIACKACKALSISMGLAHVEIKIENGKVWVIEVGARPGGDGIMDQIESVYGVNPYAIHACSYLKQDPFKHLSKLQPKGTAAIAFLKAKPGIIKDIKIPRRLPNEVRSICVHAEVGDVSQESSSWENREGVVEFFWETFFDHKLQKPITLANSLSKEIFSVRKDKELYV